MKLDFLEPLYTRPGPYACVYVDTSRNTGDPQRAIELRRRHLREELEEQGADPGTTAVLTGEVGTDARVPGRHGQAIFASRGELVLEEELPEPPVRDAASFASLPDALPLVLQHAPDIPYTAVAVRRRAPQDPAAAGPQEFEVAVEAGRWPVSRAAPGPCLHRRVAAEDWVRTAPRLAGEVAELAEGGGAETVLLAGDRWAASVLAHRLPEQLRERTVVEEGDGYPPAAGRALLEDRLAALFHDRMSAADLAVTQRFLAQRARHLGAVEGMAACLAALQRGQAAALLLNTPAELPVALWAGAEPTQVALSREELESYGALSFEEGPAGAALVRALVGTGAELVAVPRASLLLEGGVGVLLRYLDQGG